MVKEASGGVEVSTGYAEQQQRQHKNTTYNLSQLADLLPARASSIWPMSIVPNFIWMLL
jgi:hypothetical protein